MEKEAAKVDVESLERLGNKENWKKLRYEKQKALEQITAIDSDKLYSSNDIPFSEFKGRLNGKDIYSLLKSSSDWLTPAQLSRELDCTPDNVIKNLSYPFSDKTVLLNYKGIRRYLFHASVVDDYERINKYALSPKNSIRETAKKLGVSYSKIRSLIANLGLKLKTSKKRSKIVSEKAFEILKETINRDFGNLLEIPDNFPKYVVTMGEISEISTYKGIKRMHVKDFCLKII